eukprot:gb/GEZN01003988.1/.p1 GENE.gb/GEZN01003988.1/~~gb/GEZN01003988.1/.p1  ORF type:complete len:486 (+),score=77.03 gb/GEZN01003988.1/:119-1576(+)
MKLVVAMTLASGLTLLYYALRSKKRPGKDKAKPVLCSTSSRREFTFVRIVWADTSNLRRTKFVPYKNLTPELQADGIGLTPATHACPSTMDFPSPGAGVDPTGELRVVPDMTTLQALPYFPSHLMVLADLLTETKAPWLCCPRFFLKTQIERAKKLGYTVMAGFENEFILFNLDNNGKLMAVDDTIYAMTLSMHKTGQVLEEIAWALQEQGMGICIMHPESASGQFEFALTHHEVLKAVDNQIFFKETVTAIAAKHKLGVCFLPKVFAMEAGNAMHVHLSLEKDGKNIFGAAGMDVKAALQKGTLTKDLLSSEAQSFVAGLLLHLPSLLAVLAATHNSYRRLQPGCWAGAYHCWGYNNREAALRVTTHPSAGITNVEVKPLDHTANPYFALGCLIAAGLDGLEQKIELQPPCQFNPGAPEHKDKNVLRLPGSLKEALLKLEENEVLRRAIPAQLLQMYLATKRFELSQTEKMTLEEEVAVLKERF